jgi:hypothetical protein
MHTQNARSKCMLKMHAQNARSKCTLKTHAKTHAQNARQNSCSKQTLKTHAQNACSKCTLKTFKAQTNIFVRGVQTLTGENVKVVWAKFFNFKLGHFSS